MVDEVALSVVLYTLGSPAAVLLSGGGGGRSKPGVGAGAGGRRGGWWRGHRSQAPSQGGQTMMGDSGREHVRCSKADWGEKRERRTIPGPQTQNGNRERNGQSREVVSLPVSPTTPCSTQRPSRQAQISLCPHPSPPTEGATEPRACGEKGYSQARSPRESRSLWDTGATLPQSAQHGKAGTGVHKCSVPIQGQSRSRALQELEGFQERRQTRHPRQRSCPHTRPRTYQGPRGLKRSGERRGPGQHSPKTSG